jgi:hypothetical protein
LCALRGYIRIVTDSLATARLPVVSVI